MAELATMNGVLWVILGLVVGVAGRFLPPGRDDLGWLPNLVLGVGGALLGGVLATLLGFGGFRGFDVYSLVAAALAALLLVYLVRALRAGRARG